MLLRIWKDLGFETRRLQLKSHCKEDANLLPGYSGSAIEQRVIYPPPKLKRGGSVCEPLSQYDLSLHACMSGIWFCVVCRIKKYRNVSCEFHLGEF